MRERRDGKGHPRAHGRDMGRDTGPAAHWRLIAMAMRGRGSIITEMIVPSLQNLLLMARFAEENG